MTIEDVKKKFPDTPIEEFDNGFQMLDRPYHPDCIVKMLKNKVVHVGCYMFAYKNKEGK